MLIRSTMRYGLDGSLDVTKAASQRCSGSSNCRAQPRHWAGCSMRSAWRPRFVPPSTG